MWQKQTSMQPVLQQMLGTTTTSTETSTYKFPGLESIINKEDRNSKLEKVHVINFRVLSTDRRRLEPCMVWASPEEPALKVAKFAASLGSLTPTQGAPSQESMPTSVGRGVSMSMGMGMGLSGKSGRCARCKPCCCGRCLVLGRHRVSNDFGAALLGLQFEA